jgi:NAD(P)-dependent dehydrogenase (short-subunit alcohol dehydrogenase family)
MAERLRARHALNTGAGGGSGLAVTRACLDVPWGRMGTPEDAEGAAVLLAGDASACVTVQTLNVDGGNVMS